MSFIGYIIEGISQNISDCKDPGYLLFYIGYFGILFKVTISLISNVLLYADRNTVT